MLRDKDYVKVVHFIWFKGAMPEYIIKCLERALIVYNKHDIRVNLWVDEDADHANIAYLNELANHYSNFRSPKIETKPQIAEHALITSTKNFKDLSPAIQSDLYRLAILEQYGGLYMDIDYFTVDNVFDLIESIVDSEYSNPNQLPKTWEDLAMISIENEKGYHNNGTIFCAKPFNWFISCCIHRVLTAPQVLRRALRWAGPDLIGVVQAQIREAHPEGSGLFSIPWAHLHCLQWDKAAELYEKAGNAFNIYIPALYETDHASHTAYKPYAVHLWNDLLPKDVQMEFQVENDLYTTKAEWLGMHNALSRTIQLDSGLINIELPKVESSVPDDIASSYTSAFIESAEALNAEKDNEPITGLKKGESYLKLKLVGSDIPQYIKVDTEESKTMSTEETILSVFNAIESSMAGTVLSFNPDNDAFRVHAYTPLIVALCEYIYQVAKMYHTGHIALCYRDAYMIHQVMKDCPRYQNLKLYPLWINRDIAGDLAGFSGPGYQFEPDYNAYGVKNPYSVKDIDISRWQELHGTYKDLEDLEDQSYKLAKLAGKGIQVIVFDLSTCHFSAQETLQHLYPGLDFKGCYMFTFTRSTNDSYRLRDDYKAWGHITVNDENSRAMKSLEKVLSYVDPAKPAGMVIEEDTKNAAEVYQQMIIDSAKQFLSTDTLESMIPTIATALKVIPEQFKF